MKPRWSFGKMLILRLLAPMNKPQFKPEGQWEAKESPVLLCMAFTSNAFWFDLNPFKFWQNDFFLLLRHVAICTSTPLVQLLNCCLCSLSTRGISFYSSKHRLHSDHSSVLNTELQTPSADHLVLDSSGSWAQYAFLTWGWDCSSKGAWLTWSIFLMFTIIFISFAEQRIAQHIRYTLEDHAMLLLGIHHRFPLIYYIFKMMQLQVAPLLL